MIRERGGVRAFANVFPAFGFLHEAAPRQTSLCFGHSGRGRRAVLPAETDSTSDGLRWAQPSPPDEPFSRVSLRPTAPGDAWECHPARKGVRGECHAFRRA